MKTIYMVLFLVVLTDSAFANYFGKRLNLEGTVIAVCEGTTGRAEVSRYRNGDLKYSIATEELDLKGTYAPENKGMLEKILTSARVSTSYSNPISWISLTATTGDLQWVAGHWKCLPTRVPGKCHPFFQKGRYETKWKDWLSMMLDIDEQGQYTFNRVEINVPEYKGVLYSLGEKTVCQVTEL